MIRIILFHFNYFYSAELFVETQNREQFVVPVHLAMKAMEKFVTFNETSAKIDLARVHFNAYRPMSRRSSSANLVLRDTTARMEWNVLISTSATLCILAIKESVAQICRLDLDAMTAHRDITLCRSMINHSNGNDARMLTSAAKESLNVVKIRNASTLTEPTSAHVSLVSPCRTQQTAAFKFQDFALMV